ncbi:hypothetical protein NKZ05_04320 [Stutzerimonas stutzeri]|uniref:hypothetical protein n=1 Tax=Stutzerimonas stutzeri TaxID=316 RepID=UPI00387DCFC8
MDGTPVVGRFALLGKRAPITIIGVVLLGIAGSALYDLFVKPGINIISKALFYFFTFGSQQVKDYSFKTAALDPTSLPSVIVLIALVSFVINIPLRTFIRARAQKADDVKKEANKSISLVRRRIVLLFVLIFNVAIVFVPFNVFNQAVVAWRVFNSNLAILAPEVAQQDILKFKAEFASMESERDYRVLEDKLERVAQSKKLNLRAERPW